MQAMRAFKSEPDSVVRNRRAHDQAEEVLWVSRCANGDLAAFERLYNVYYPRLSRFLDRMTRRPHLVEELLNDTMLVVWHKAAAYNHQSKVSTWILGIAYRKGLKALRDLDDPVETDSESLEGDQRSRPDEALMKLQLQRVLFSAVEALSVEHRAVVELTYFHGAGYREISEIMNCPIDTVKTRMFYARRRLKALLPDGMEEIS
jgi:RNA polymerase sigma-70 factor (ECF subfamily)